MTNAKNKAPIFKGDTVKIAPWTDLFMRGERTGEVVKIGRKYITIKGARSGRAFRFALDTDALETTAPRVTLNLERELYVIRSGAPGQMQGYSCLGFDVCAKRTAAYVAWIERQGRELPFQSDELAPRGSLEAFEQYETATAAIYAIHKATGARCDAELVPELKGLEGRRVEVVDCYGETRRFQVGKSTGWIPIHLELSSSRAMGGGPAYGAPYQSVRVIA